MVQQPGHRPPSHRLMPGDQVVDTTVGRNRGEVGASGVSWGKIRMSTPPNPPSCPQSSANIASTLPLYGSRTFSGSLFPLLYFQLLCLTSKTPSLPVCLTFISLSSPTMHRITHFHPLGNRTGRRCMLVSKSHVLPGCAQGGREEQASHQPQNTAVCAPSDRDTVPREGV